MTVQSDNADPFARMDDEVEIVNHPQRAVAGGQTLDFQNLGHRLLSASQNRLRGPQDCR